MMKLLRLIKMNTNFRSYFIVATLGWLFFVVYSFVAVFLTVNQKIDFLIEDYIAHTETQLLRYNDNTRLIASMFDDHPELVTEQMFIDSLDSLIGDDAVVDIVFYAPSGVIDYVYPEEEKDEYYGYDVMAGTSIYDNSLMIDAINNHSIMYKYISENDIVDLIYIRQPIYNNDIFIGFITMVLDASELRAIPTSHYRDTLSTSLYTSLDVLLLGTTSNQDHYGNVTIDGIDFTYGYSVLPSVYVDSFSNYTGFALTVSLTLLILLYIVFKDKMKETQLEEELEYRQNYDIETDIYNIERLYRDLTTLISSNESFYLSFISMNNVKYINDKFGHVLTSQLIKKTTGLINTVLRNNSTLYRYGGDEYIIISKAETKSEIKNIIRRVIKVFDTDIISGKIKTRLSITIGIADFPNNGNKAEELIKRAHFTSAQISKYDKEGFDFYRHEKEKFISVNEDFDKMVANLNLELFEVYLMPIVEVQSNKIAGFECLSRAFDSFDNNLHTEEVILSLERNGKIQVLDEIVFKKMLRIMKRINDTFPQEDYYLSLNASALSLNEDYVNNIIRYYKEAKLKKGQIVLELTESYQVEDYDYLIELFNKLNRNGILISIDDFGSGYSSISYISKFPIYSIKIDKQYATDFEHNEFNKTLLKTMLSISGVLGCKLIAEGVDSFETLAYLKDMNCQYYQGYLFSKGVPVEAALNLIRNNLEKTKN